MVPDDYVWEGDGVLPMRGWCQQDGVSCGLVAAFMMLAYFLPAEFPFRELKNRCPVCPRKGTSLAEIGAALASYGLSCCMTVQLTKREVSDAIKAGSPVMVVVSGNYIGYADMAGTEKRTRKEIIQAAFPPPPTLKRERPLEDILTQRWEPFIKDIPFTKHREVYHWITRKLNQPRW